MQIIEQQGTDQSDIEQARPSSKSPKQKRKKSVQPRQLTIKDASQFGMALSQLAKSAQILYELVQPHLKQSYQMIGKKQGMSYLDVRNSLMLSYMTNLTFYMILKAKGKTIEDHPVILRLAYLKALFEKLRPLDSKLKYQIQKATQMANDQMGSIMTMKDNDFKPRPSQMMTQKLNQELEEIEIEQQDDDDEQQIKPNKYKAPRTSTTLTDKQLAKQRKKLNSSKKNLARTALMMQLHQEMYDIPEQAFERQDINRKELDQEAKIDEYQENQYKRVTQGKEIKMKIKKQKKEAREQIKMKAGLDGLSLNQITNALNRNKQSQEEVLLAEKRVAQQQAMKDSINRTQVGRSLLQARKKVGLKGAKNQVINDFDLGEPLKKKKKSYSKQSQKAKDIVNNIDDIFYQNEMKQLNKKKLEKKQKAQMVNQYKSLQSLNFRKKTKIKLIFQISKKTIKGIQTIACLRTKASPVIVRNKIVIHGLNFTTSSKKHKRSERYLSTHLVKEATQQRGNYQGQETGLRTTIIKSRRLDG